MSGSLNTLVKYLHVCFDIKQINVKKILIDVTTFTFVSSR